jgi:heme oxygenase
VQEYQYQEPYLRRDLAAFRADANGVAPTAGTRAFLEWLDSPDGRAPLALLGCHYVVEGSNNGSRYIAKAIRRAFGIEGSAGVEYLDPYGDEQPARWARFKSDLDSAGLGEVEADRLVAAAKVMFETIGRISDDLARAVPA